MAERLVAADASPLIGLAAAKNARLAHSARPLPGCLGNPANKISGWAFSSAEMGSITSGLTTTNGRRRTMKTYLPALAARALLNGLKRRCHQAGVGSCSAHFRIRTAGR